MSQFERRVGDESWSRRTFLRRMGLAGAAVAAGGLLPACGDDEPATGGAGGGDRPSQAGQPLSIGFMIPIFGVFAALAKDMQEGMQLYLEERGGQIAGRPVTLIVEDTEANPEVGVRKAQKLLRQDRVPLAMGIVSSAVALGVRDLFHEEEVPLIVSNAGANDITRKAKSPFIFRTSFSNWQCNYSGGQWFYDNVAKDGVFVIAPDYAAGKEHIAGFREAFEKAGGKIIGEVYPPFGRTQDYQPFISQIRASGARAVWAFFAGAEAVSFVRQYREFGLKDQIPLLGSGFLTDDGVLPAQGDAALGLRTSLHYTPLLDNPANKKFVESYRRRFNRMPTVYAAQQYDSGTLLELALKQTNGNTDARAVTEAMANVGEIDSPRGRWKMDPNTHNPVQTFWMREVRNTPEAGLANVPIRELGVFPDPG